MTEIKEETVLPRIQNYLEHGGLFNPEMMEHDKVRDLLVDCRAALIAKASETCEWRLRKDGTWVNGCGTKAHLLSGTSPIDCGLKFCGYCGKRLAETKDDTPQSLCPKCHEPVDDLDGFGVLAHDKCGYCSHPSITDGVCGICGKLVETKNKEEGK